MSHNISPGHATWDPDEEDPDMNNLSALTPTATEEEEEEPVEKIAGQETVEPAVVEEVLDEAEEVDELKALSRLEKELREDDLKMPDGEEEEE